MIRVVIIDDEPIIVEGLTRSVNWEKWGCEVVGTALSGEEGMEVIRAKKPDILFSDIRMTGISGLTMIAGLKSEHPDMEITILTGYRDFDYAREAIRLGVTRFLLKPSRMDEIREAVETMVNNLAGKGILPRGEKLLSQGDTILSQGEKLLPQGDTILSRGEKLLPQGDTILSQGEKLLPQGDTILSQGRKRLPQEHKTAAEGVDGEAGHPSPCEGGSSTGRIDEVTESEAGSFIVNNAIAFIEKNYRNKLKLEDVAEQVYVSQWHLSKLLNRYKGQSFSDILNSIRIENAKELLRDPSLRIGDIAELVGFLDMAHFSRVFKKISGVTANEYRNTLRGSGK